MATTDLARRPLIGLSPNRLSFWFSLPRQQRDPCRAWRGLLGDGGFRAISDGFLLRWNHRGVIAVVAVEEKHGLPYRREQLIVRCAKALLHGAERAGDITLDERHQSERHQSERHQSERHQSGRHQSGRHHARGIKYGNFVKTSIISRLSPVLIEFPKIMVLPKLYSYSLAVRLKFPIHQTRNFDPIFVESTEFRTWHPLFRGVRHNPYACVGYRAWSSRP
jgi:hypothetical protein